MERRSSPRLTYAGSAERRSDTAVRAAPIDVDVGCSARKTAGLTESAACGCVAGDGAIERTALEGRTARFPIATVLPVTSARPAYSTTERIADSSPVAVGAGTTCLPHSSARLTCVAATHQSAIAGRGTRAARFATAAARQTRPAATTRGACVARAPTAASLPDSAAQHTRPAAARVARATAPAAAARLAHAAARGARAARAHATRRARRTVAAARSERPTSGARGSAAGDRAVRPWAAGASGARVGRRAVRAAAGGSDPPTAGHAGALVAGLVAITLVSAGSAVGLVVPEGDVGVHGGVGVDHAVAVVVDEVAAVLGDAGADILVGVVAVGAAADEGRLSVHVVVEHGEGAGGRDGVAGLVAGAGVSVHAVVLRPADAAGHASGGEVAG
jgi:hypothetical protein